MTHLSISTAVRIALGAGLLLSGPVMAAESVAAAGREDEDEELETLEAVVVTARNREESVQDIPIPVTVLNAGKLETFGIQTVWDLEFHTPNIELNPPGENARKVSAKIRGLGVAGANDSAEKSVSTIVDGVSLYYSGQAWANYVDLDRIEVLSGPQGTLQGKNSSLGAIRIITKAPSFNKEATYEISTGDLNTLNGKFSATGPLIGDKLAYRGTFSGTRGDGIYTNTYQSFGKSKETWREQSQYAGRFQLLWVPIDDLRARFIFDKLRSDERVNTGNVLTSNGPANYAWGTPRPTFTPIGYTPTGTYTNYGLLGKWAERSAWFHNDDGSVYEPKFNTTDIENSEARPQVTNQWGVSGQLDYEVLDHTLTYLGAYRYQDFDIKNGGQNGRWYIGNSGQQLFNNQTSHELRLASTPAPDRKLDYQIGLYYLSARVYSDDPTSYGPDAGAWNASTTQYSNLVGSGLGRELLRQSQNGIYRSQVTDAEVWSRAAFGQVDWHITSRAKLTAGYRLTHETKKNRIRQELDRGVADGSDLVSIFNSLQAGNDAIDGNGNAVAGGNARLLADALALRATAIGGGTVSGSGATATITPTRLYDFKVAEPIKDNLSAWTLSPSFEITRDVSVYASVAQGAKSGYINFSSAGEGAHIKPEKSRDYELGIKSLLLHRKLLLNANLYRTQVKNYQASWRRPNPLDPDNRAADITGTGNVESIGAKGFELQATYQVFPGFTINMNSSYNIAKYETDWLVALPPQTDAELTSPRYINAKGQQLASVPRFGNAYGMSYRRPVGPFLASVSVSNRYVGKKYSQDYHTADTLREGYNLTNLVVGLGSGDEDSWEVSARITNLFDKSYGNYGTWGATSAATATPGAPRNLQLVFRSRL